MTALLRAHALLQVDRADEALRELAGLPASEIESQPAMVLRCAALSRLDRWDELAVAVRAGLAANGPDPVLLRWMGRSERHEGRPASAERALLDGLALDPVDVDLLCEYAELCAQQNQPDKAAKLVALAMEQDPGAPIVYATRIQVAYANADDKEAQRISREFLAAFPDNPGAQALYGSASAARGDYDEAYAGFRQAAAAMPAEQSFAESAMELHYLRHPLIRPLLPIARFGSLKTWFLAVATIFLLQSVGLRTLSAVVAAVWLLFCVYSWTVPFLVRRWLRRRSF